MKQYRLTKEGYESLLKELDDLVKNKRKEVAERLKSAKEFGGDLTDNSEYEHAKNDQAFIEGRIEQINMILQNYEIIKNNKKKSKIDLGATVVLKDLESGKEKVFELVSSIESNPDKNKISDESPLGMALIGKKIDDKVEVKAPHRDKKFKIIKIN
jgi:transcription elongation factor GreA